MKAHKVHTKHHFVSNAKTNVPEKTDIALETDLKKTTKTFFTCN